jgi:bifunctional NMN adenylyltransferase/nudix hydrolase
MNKKYDNAVVIMRAQPLHNAHLELINRAAELAKNVIILLGSSKQPRTFKNPFTFSERCGMILRSIKLDPAVQVYIEPLVDIPYNDQVWVLNVQDIVAECTHGNSICLLGHNKDSSTGYLKMFPQWSFEDFDNVANQLNATDIRDLYFKRPYNQDYIKGVVPDNVLEFLNEFHDTPDYNDILEEKEFIEKYKQQFAGLQYAPVFVTVDCLIIQSGHVLMIKRRSNPGKNLMALPGGYLNAGTDRSLLDAAIRELKEETGIKVPEPVLRGSIIQSKVFDAIDRDPRGRVITHAFHIELPAGPLPKVKGMDDALKAKWVPLSEITSENCYSDHAEIIKVLVGI